MNAVVVTLHIHSQNSIELRLARAFDTPDMRDSSVVYQNIQRALSRNLAKSGEHLRLICDVALVRRRGAASAHDFAGNGFRVILIQIQNPDPGSVLRKLERDGASNAAAAAGDCGRLS